MNHPAFRKLADPTLLVSSLGRGLGGGQIERCIPKFNQATNSKIIKEQSIDCSLFLYSFRIGKMTF